MNNQNKCEVNSIILLFAFRYALRRMSYAPSMVANTIKENIGNMPSNDLRLIVKEIEENEYYGTDFDKSTWFSLKEFIEVELTKRDD